MRRKLLIVALTTAMVATLLTGCGEKDDTKESNTTTPATKVEQSDNNNANAPTSNEEDTKKEDSANKEDVKPYNETYDVELNMDEIEEDYKWDLENLNETYAENNKKNAILKHEVTKYVFEDMTKKFKNKEEVSVTGVITITALEGDEGTSLVCDVSEMVPEGSPYTEFAGFYLDENDAITKKNEDGALDYIEVVLGANKIQEEEGGRFKTPMYVTLTIDVNEDGTYSYRELYIQYMLD